MNPFVKLDRRIPVAMKIGIPVTLVTIAAFALQGALSISEARLRIDQTFEAEAAAITRAVQSHYQLVDGDLEQMSDYVRGLDIARPSVERVQVIREGFGNIPFVWASSASSDIAVSFDPMYVPEPGGATKLPVDINERHALMIAEGVDFGADVVAVVSYFSNGPRDAALESLTRRIAIQATLILALELLIIAGTVYLVVIRRLKRMERAAEHVAEGDLEVRLPEGTEPVAGDELVNVAREFDRMIRAVDSRTRALQDAAERERDDADKLRKLDAMKNTLLHAVSHDLRSPITSVLGSARTLSRADDLGLNEEDRQMLLEGLSSGAMKMQRLVTDLLDLDRIGQGIVHPKRRPTDIDALIDRVVAESATTRERELHIDAEPLNMAVDTAQIERIVDNLLGNAVKHTRDGDEVWISAHPFEDGVLIKVEDSGPGIPQELRETIFEPFRQGPDDQNTPGVGIGLSLVSRFAELHGGRAWVGERAGGGASFNVYIPDGEAEPEEEPEERPVR